MKIAFIIALCACSLFLTLLIFTYDNLGEARELNSKNEAIIEVQNKRLKEPEQSQSTTTKVTKTLDQETFEFAISTNKAMQTYIITLQNIMDNNGVTYPKFIYQEITEGE